VESTTTSTTKAKANIDLLRQHSGNLVPPGQREGGPAGESKNNSGNQGRGSKAFKGIHGMALGQAESNAISTAQKMGTVLQPMENNSSARTNRSKNPLFFFLTFSLCLILTTIISSTFVSKSLLYARQNLSFRRCRIMRSYAKVSSFMLKKG